LQILTLTPTAFWIYVCASVLLLVGLVRVLKELPRLLGSDKIMPFGRLFFAIPLAVFGSEHFTATAAIASAIPSWIPAHMFWVYAVGAGFLCGGLAIVVLVQARLAAALVGLTMFIFVVVMDARAVVANPHNRFFWALMLRELAFSGGALAFAMSSWSARTRSLTAVPRFFVGIPSVFYGVVYLLHPENVPAIPLNRLTPEWIHGRILLSYFVGVILILAGASLVTNVKPRAAATFLGLTVLLTVCWVYLPMLLAAPRDVTALNFFFDTLMFSGAVLLLANATDRVQSPRR